MTMPFGKFKGERLVDLPDDYLEWLDGIDLRPFLRAAVDAELRRRMGDEEAPAPTYWPAPVRDAAIGILRAGFRELAKQVHPDAGGTGDGASMAALVDARDRLAAWVEGD